MEKYLKVKSVLEDNNCKLLTSFEEFEHQLNILKIYDKIRIKFIGICSHISNSVFVNFYYRKTGLRCKDCVVKNIKQKLNIYNVDNKNYTNKIEYEGINMLNNILIPYYIIKRTPEGCNCDIAIKIKEEEKDIWIPIQVKTTEKQNNMSMYTFSLNNKDNIYKNIMIICVCINEKKVWVIPIDIIKAKSKINICNKSKYNEYLITDTNTIDKAIQKCLKYVVQHNLEKLMTPSSHLQKREQDYIRKREKYLSFLKYEYPDIQGSCVDFIINGKNIQEKVVGFDKNRERLLCTVAKNNGTLYGKRTIKVYDKGDNDYYWFHSSIDDRFWIIPEEILVKYGYIDYNNQKTKKTLIFKFDWLKKYEYNYNTVDKDIIKTLF